MLLRAPGAEASRRAGALEPTGGPLRRRGPVVLYAPTWRDGEPDPSAPDDGDLGRDRRLARARRLGAGRAHAPARAAATTPAARAVGAGADARRRPAADVTPVAACRRHAGHRLLVDRLRLLARRRHRRLPAADVSTYLAPAASTSATPTFTGGHHVVIVAARPAPCSRTSSARSGCAAAAQRTPRWLRDEFFDHIDGRSTERVLAEIRARVGRPSRGATSGAAQTGRRVTACTSSGDQLRVGPEPGRQGPRPAWTGRAGASTATLDAIRHRRPVPAARDPLGHAGPRAADRRLPARSSADLPTTRVGVAATLLDELHALFRVRASRGGRRSGGAHRAAAAPTARAGSRAARLRLALPAPAPASRTPSTSRASTAAPPSCNPLGDRPGARPHAPGRAPVLERRRRLGRRARPGPCRSSRTAASGGACGRGAAVRRQRLAALDLPTAGRGQHVLQTWHGTMLKRLALRPAGRRRPRRRFATHPAGPALERPARPERLQRKRSSARPTPSAARSGRPATRATTCSPTRLGRARGAQRLGVAARRARRALRADLARRPRRDRRLPRPGDFAARCRRTTCCSCAATPARSPSGRPACRAARRRHELSRRRRPHARGRRARHGLLVDDVRLRGHRQTDGVLHPGPRPLQRRPARLLLRPARRCAGPGRGHAQDLLDAIGDVVDAATYADRHTAWRARFAPHDDGHAGERAVERMVDAGWLP